LAQCFISIAGLQRSGTNYFEKLLGCVFENLALQQSFWKHALPGEVGAAQLSQSTIVLVVRHPAMWLQSCMDHTPVDLLSTRNEFFCSDDVLSYYANLFNTFAKEWLTYIDSHDGVFVRHEDLLRADYSGLGALERRGTSREAQGRPPTISRVPHSIEYTEIDSRRDAELFCHLEPECVRAFWRRLDRNILERFAYRVEDVRFTDQPSVRTIAYKLVREPQLVTPEAFESLADVAEAVFPRDGVVLCAIGKRYHLSGNWSKAEVWYNLALKAVSPDRVNAEEYSDLHTLNMYRLGVELDSLEGLGDIARRTSRVAADADGWADGFGYEEAYAQALARALSYIETCVHAPDGGAPPVANDWSFYGQMLARAGRMEEAIDATRRAVAADPHSLDYVWALASLQFHDARFADVVATLREDWGLDGRGVARHQLLSQALEAQGALSEALSEAALAVRGPDADPDHLHRYGMLLARCGEPEKAVDVLRDASRRDPGKARHHQAIGELLQRLGRTDEALAEAALAQASPTAAAWHSHHYGALLAARGRLQEAEQVLRKAVVQEPEDAQHWQLLSEILQRSGRPAGALTAAEAALECPSAGPWQHHWQGTLLAAAGRVGEAESAFRRAVRGNPTDWRSRIELSLVLRKLGRIDDALAEAEQAVSCGGANAHVLRHRGLLLAMLGQFKQAEESLVRARAAGLPLAKYLIALAQVTLERAGVAPLTGGRRRFEFRLTGRAR
jgi:Flp pilus assembly protein TadD